MGNLAAPRLHVTPSPQPSDHTLQAPTMKFLLLSLLSLTYAQNAPCPTITSRTSICSTCVQPLCLAISTVTPVLAVRRLWPRCLRSFPALRGTRTAVGVPVAVAERNGLLRRRRLVRRSRLNVRTSECGWFEDDMSSYQGATGASGT